MIRRLHVDNFKSLVNFTWEPKAENLLLGYNGSGKTTALDAINLIRSWTSGQERLQDLLSVRDLTRWSASEVAKFELDLESEEGLFRYSAEFVCNRKGGDATVLGEALSVDGRPIILRSGTGLVVYDEYAKVVGQYSIPITQSAVMSVASSDHPELSRAFLAALARMVVVRPTPPLLESAARKPEPEAKYRFQNFIAWLQNWLQQEKFSRQWSGLLSDVWDEFDYVEFERFGRDETGLNVVFRRPTGAGGEFKLEFGELSEGEQMLVVLYALVAYQRAGPPSTIVIDEPDNFIALSELQPWLLKMLGERPALGQVILVSHNTEIIQTMGGDSVSYFSRADHMSPTVISEIPDDESGLSLSQRLTLGWLDAPVGR